MTTWIRREAPFAAIWAGLVLLVAVLQAIAYWPGLMTWDAVRQYGQALSGDYDDWHPPAMEWLWRQLTAIHRGPAPMLVLQLALYWSGYAALAAWALKHGRHRLALAIVCAAILPIPLALMGAVLKDCLMAGALLAATGLLAWSGEREGQGGGLRFCGVVLVIFTATLRFNAFLADVPLLVALLPAPWWRGRLRLAASVLGATIVLGLAMPVANRLLHARPSGVALSLVIFDLGGITEHSGIDAFPPLDVTGPVAVNHHCYSPAFWDPYSWWVDEPCAIGFENVGAALKARGENPYVFWLEAIAAHPIAYAQHRLTHFNINARFLVRGDVQRPVQNASAPNDWGYTVGPNALLSFIDRLAFASADTPLGWPICWIALALGVLILGPVLPSRRLAVPLALSAVLYGLGYGVFSVASELRYQFWTIIAALLAALVAGSDLAHRSPIRRLRLVLAAAPVIVVTALCFAWRA